MIASSARRACGSLPWEATPANASFATDPIETAIGNGRYRSPTTLLIDRSVDQTRAKAAFRNAVQESEPETARSRGARDDGQGSLVVRLAASALRPCGLAAGDRRELASPRQTTRGPSLPPLPGPRPSGLVPVGWITPGARKRAVVIWRFFLDVGLGRVEAAAFLGNFLVETAYSLSPYAKNVFGYQGLAQWQPGKDPRSGAKHRWELLKDYAARNRLYRCSIWTQLEFVATELSGLLRSEGDDYSSVLAQLRPYRHVTDPAEAGRVVDTATDIVTSSYEQAINRDGSLQEGREREYEARFVLHDLWRVA